MNISWTGSVLCGRNLRHAYFHEGRIFRGRIFRCGLKMGGVWAEADTRRRGLTCAGGGAFFVAWVFERKTQDFKLYACEMCTRTVSVYPVRMCVFEFE